MPRSEGGRGPIQLASSNLCPASGEEPRRPLTSRVRLVGYPPALAARSVPGAWPIDAPASRVTGAHDPPSRTTGIGAAKCEFLVLGGDGYLGWPTALHLSALGHEVAVNDNFARRGYDEEMGVESLVPICTLEERITAWTEVERQDDQELRRRSVRCRVRPRDGRRLQARHDRPLRRAARRALLDDRPGALHLHADQQHRRQPECDVRDRRHRSRHPPGQARDDGRVRNAEHRYRGGLARGRAQRPQGPHDVPEAARLLLPPLEGARQPQHRVRVSHLGPPRHRPQPGRRVRGGHRAVASSIPGSRRDSTTTACSARC